MCHARSHLHAMTGPGAPAPSTGPGLRRASGPEIFTFEPLPEPAGASPARLGPSRAHRKRSRRVLYPRVVRRPRPSEEPSVAKRALFLLLAVVFCQILMAEEGVSQPLAPEDAPGAASPEPASAPPALAPLNLTSESSSDYALDLKAFLQQHPAAF
ncbi:radiation-inducible immediate-early gene IEX-1 [Psammomys obesus]|uniref:radiation-inducible immediate-early gene IEX-1 n=1 Tax=Psammomys obesus TaxID=48139 RepID=UPI002452E6D0|nr:radiation-inducible immediate-early gene IEX-1 [Psammomys obesus]